MGEDPKISRPKTDADFRNKFSKTWLTKFLTRKIFIRTIPSLHLSEMRNFFSSDGILILHIVVEYHQFKKYFTFKF